VPFGVNTLKCLIKNELWFGSPHNLNDPFESKFDINFIGGDLPTSDALIDFYQNDLLINTAVKEKIIRLGIDVNFILRDITECLQKSIKEKFGICSFSKSYLDTRMWSHYAESHSGICLIFDKEILYNSFSKNSFGYHILESDIIYSEFPHSINISFVNNKVCVNDFDREKIINSKLLDWQDEKEIRYSIEFFNPNSPRAIPFNPEALQGIILGEKIDHDNAGTLVHLLKNNKDFIWAKAFMNYTIGKMDSYYIKPTIQQPSNQVIF